MEQRIAQSQTRRQCQIDNFALAITTPAEGEATVHSILLTRERPSTFSYTFHNITGSAATAWRRWDLFRADSNDELVWLATSNVHGLATHRPGLCQRITRIHGKLTCVVSPQKRCYTLIHRRRPIVVGNLVRNQAWRIGRQRSWALGSKLGWVVGKTWSGVKVMGPKGPKAGKFPREARAGRTGAVVLCARSWLGLVLPTHTGWVRCDVSGCLF